MPDELNDPADEIFWSNLITYYWKSFIASERIKYYPKIRDDVFLPGHHVLTAGNHILEGWEMLDPYLEKNTPLVHDQFRTQRAEILSCLNKLSSLSSNELALMLSTLTPPEEFPRMRDDRSPTNFPQRFLQSIGRLTISPWRLASFTSDFTNPALWSSYANSHTGVCLVFDRKHLANLRQPLGWSPIEIEDVSYRQVKPEISFMDFVPRLTTEWYESLFSDESGKWSLIAPYRLEDGDDARVAFSKKRRESTRTNLLTKHKQWETEREVRMFCWSGFDEEMDPDPATRTIQYPIEALKGVIFGLRTKRKYREAILDVILAKHYASPIRPDFWFAEAQQEPDGSIRRKFDKSYVSWQGNFVYPRNI